MSAPRNCIFCGRRGRISKEHFWPQWLGRKIARPDQPSTVSEIHVGEGKSRPRLHARAVRQGDVTTRKLRVVCRFCNNGWMNTLEGQVKPLVLARLEGLDSPLTTEQTFALARWISMKAMLSEHEQRDVVLTPPEDRAALFQRSEIPGYYRIFVAAHSSKTHAAFFRHSTTVSRTKEGPDPKLPPGIRRNIQAITWLAGPLCFFVLAARVMDLDLDKIFRISVVTRIWPAPESAVNLATLAVIDNAGLYNLSRAIETLIDQPNVVYGGPLPS